MGEMNGYWQRFVKQVHPEGIPWPWCVLYNALSRTAIFHQHYELVAREIARTENAGRILDLGTGPGHLLLALRRQLPKTKLVGVDISPAMVVQAQRNLRKHGPDSEIEIQAASAEALPFEDETFDGVVSTGSFHHWKDPTQGLCEAYRVLKANGWCLIYDLVRDMPPALRQEVRSRFGSFRLALLWLHSFEEPFLHAGEMEALGGKTEFLVEGTRLTGALCCLVLRKTDISKRNIGDCPPDIRGVDMPGL